jgi:uracil-DNA glycosylase
MDTILFVGSNTSNASVDDSAFHPSTKSRQILDTWCKDLVGAKVYINVTSKKTEENRPLRRGEIKANLDVLAGDINRIAPTKIVALGKTASIALTLLGLKFYEMPHPSGCNRKLNNKEYVAEKIKGLLEYTNNPSIKSSETKD